LHQPSESIRPFDLIALQSAGLISFLAEATNATVLSVSADISDRVAFDGRVKMTVRPGITVRPKTKQHGSENNLSGRRFREILDISEDWGSSINGTDEGEQ
jgi:hypothetical protein